MSTENRNGPEETAAAEPFDLAKRIAELEAQGIVSPSKGPRESLWQRPNAKWPGALKWFLDREYQDRPRSDQE